MPLRGTEIVRSTNGRLRGLKLTSTCRLRWINRVMNERTWDGVYGHPEASSAIGKDPSVTVPFDPNNEKDEAAIKFWISFSDFYVWPHIQTFGSWDELIGRSRRARYCGPHRSIHRLKGWRKGLSAPHGLTLKLSSHVWRDLT